MKRFVDVKIYNIFICSLVILVSSFCHADIINISTVNELLKIGKDINYPLNGEYSLQTDLNLTGSQTWDNGKGFEPIGTETSPFTGKFYGNGYKITGLFINRPSNNNVGIFAVLGKDGEIKNLAIEQASVIGKDNVGILCGYNKGVINNCYVLGAVEGQNGTGTLVGQNDNKIENCFGMGYVRGGTWVGGFIGRNEGGKVSYCYFVGKVCGEVLYGGFIGANNEGTVVNSYWDRDIAGITNSAGGISKTTVQMKKKDTYENWDFQNVWDIKVNINYPYLKTWGEVQFPQPPRKNISSIEQLQKIGKEIEYPWFGIYTLTRDFDAKHTKTWNNGKGFEPISAFGGQLDGNGKRISQLYIKRFDADNVGIVRKLVAGGRIMLLNLEDCEITGSWKVGGIVGQSENGSIENCKVSGKITGNTYVGGVVGLIKRGTVVDCIYKGTVEGYDTVGGIVGKNENATVNRCTSSGEVHGDFVAGGLLGWNSGGNVSECFSTAELEKLGSEYIGGFVGINDKTILNCYSTGNITAYDWLGGFVGWNNGTINKCYSVGVVTSYEVNLKITKIGGFCGYNGKGAVIIYSYWDTEVSTQANSDGGEPRTTKEMKCSTTYKDDDDETEDDWDFVEIWYMKRGIDYPVLRWQDEIDGEGSFEGDLEGIDECEGEGIEEGEEEGIPEEEGEGTEEGTTEGKAEGVVEGKKEGEGAKEGEALTKEQFLEILKTKFAELDTNGDGAISYSEAVSKYPNLTLDVFNSLDTDKNGSISKSEAGIEDTTKTGCGCFNGKSMVLGLWWKYLLDFVLMGMLLFVISGMEKREK